MSWLEFFDGLVSSLAWPASLVAVTFILKKPIVDVLKRLRKAKYGDAQFEFAEILDEIRADAEILPPMPPSAGERNVPPASVAEASTSNTPNADASLAPEVAVIRAWSEVEQALRGLALGLGVNPTRNYSWLYFVRILESRQVIAPSLGGMVRGLSRLRNLAAHPQDDHTISAEQAEEYVGLAHQAVLQLRNASR